MLLIADPCELNPCKNGGTCKPKDDTFECDCIPGYTGMHCEEGECVHVTSLTGQQDTFAAIKKLRNCDICNKVGTIYISPCITVCTVSIQMGFAKDTFAVPSQWRKYR